MLGLRAHIEEAEAEVVETEELPVEEDIVQEADEKALDSEAAEVEMDNQAMEEAEQLLEESVEADKSADKALETPAEVTEDDVKAASASLESALFALQDKAFYKDQSLKVQAAYEDYGNNPAMRLQACQEGIKETIAKLIETIKNIFRRVIAWFKKQYAKFIAMISRTASKAKKLKSVLAKKGESVKVPADEAGMLFYATPYIESVSDIGESARDLGDKKLAADYATLIDNVFNRDIQAELKKLEDKSPIDDSLFVDFPENAVPLSVSAKGVKALIRDEGKISVKFVKFDAEKLKNANNKEIEIKNTELKAAISAIESAAKNSKGVIDACFKAVEKGASIANKLEALQKRVYKEETDEITEAGILKATNIGRKLASDVAVTIALGTVRGLSDLLTTSAKLVSQLPSKEGKTSLNSSSVESDSDSPKPKGKKGK